MLLKSSVSVAITTDVGSITTDITATGAARVTGARDKNGIRVVNEEMQHPAMRLAMDLKLSSLIDVQLGLRCFLGQSTHFSVQKYVLHPRTIALRMHV